MPKTGQIQVNSNGKNNLGPSTPFPGHSAYSGLTAGRKEKKAREHCVWMCAIVLGMRMNKNDFFLSSSSTVREAYNAILEHTQNTHTHLYIYMYVYIGVCVYINRYRYGVYTYICVWCVCT